MGLHGSNLTCDTVIFLFGRTVQHMVQELISFEFIAVVNLDNTVNNYGLMMSFCYITFECIKFNAPE